MSNDEELNQAIALIMAGKKNDALPILRNILLIRANRNNEIAWLSLGTCLETKEDKIYCFREAQRINPNNEQAKKALEQLTPNSTATPHVDRDTLQLARMIQPKPKPKSVISNRSFQVFIGIMIICAVIGISMWRGQAASYFSPKPTGTPGYFQTEISQRIETAAFLAKLPPTSTPTPDQKSNFEKCELSGSGVRYVIIGTGVTRVSISLQNDTGGINQGYYDVPFCETFTNFQSGDFLHISAQISYPTSGAGSIICRIYDGNTVIAEDNANSSFPIADCRRSAY